MRGDRIWSPLHHLHVNMETTAPPGPSKVTGYINLSRRAPLDEAIDLALDATAGGRAGGARRRQPGPWFRRALRQRAPAGDARRTGADGNVVSASLSSWLGERLAAHGRPLRAHASVRRAHRTRTDRAGAALGDGRPRRGRRRRQRRLLRHGRNGHRTGNGGAERPVPAIASAQLAQRRPGGEGPHRPPGLCGAGGNRDHTRWFLSAGSRQHPGGARGRHRHLHLALDNRPALGHGRCRRRV